MDFREAVKLAGSLAGPLHTESVRLEEGLGRIAAETVVAPFDLPREKRSRLDGYAARSSDTKRAKPDHLVGLQLLEGTSAAGHAPDRGIAPGECLRILTGAPVPEGADVVFAQEDVEVLDQRIIIRKALRPGSGMLFPGSDSRAGEILAAAHEMMTPTRLALIASFGYEFLPVYSRPVVALLSTGDEVAELGQPLVGPKTFCNNRHLLSWLVKLYGGIPVHLGTAADDPASIRDFLKKGEDINAAVVVTTGGVGQGDRDFVAEAWERLGVRRLFSKLDLSPGRNSSLGVKNKTIFFGFPGNPWAAQVLFMELVVPVLRGLQGELGPPASLSAVLKRPVAKEKGIAKVVRGMLDLSSKGCFFIPEEPRGASVADRMRNSFAYILLESHMVEVPAGSMVDVRLPDVAVGAAVALHVGSVGS